MARLGALGLAMLNRPKEKLSSLRQKLARLRQLKYEGMVFIGARELLLSVISARA